MPDPGAGVCRVCCGPASATRTPLLRLPGRGAAASACRWPPVLPARLCPLPGPLYTVLLGYKESPVAEARLRFGAIVRCALARPSSLGQRAVLDAALGGPFDLVRPGALDPPARPGAPRRSWTARRRRGRGAAGGDAGLACLLRSCRRSGGPPPVAHMRPDPAAFCRAAAERAASRAHGCSLLDDTYVSGARSQSAAAALRRAGARSVVDRRRSVACCAPTGSTRHADVPAPARHLSGSGAPERSGAPVHCPRSDGGVDRVAHTGQLLGRPPQRGGQLGARAPAATVAPAWAGRRARTGGPDRCTGPSCTDEEVAAHRTGSAPPAADCPSVDPVARPQLAPHPARSRAPPRCRPGCCGSSPDGPRGPVSAVRPARRRRPSSAVKRRLASLEVP